VVVVATSVEKSEVDCTSTSMRPFAMAGKEGAPASAVDMSVRLRETRKRVHRA
jgi:hypothetical protein